MYSWSIIRKPRVRKFCYFIVACQIIFVPILYLSRNYKITGTRISVSDLETVNVEILNKISKYQTNLVEYDIDTTDAMELESENEISETLEHDPTNEEQILSVTERETKKEKIAPITGTETEQISSVTQTETEKISTITTTENEKLSTVTTTRRDEIHYMTTTEKEQIFLTTSKEKNVSKEEKEYLEKNRAMERPRDSALVFQRNLVLFTIREMNLRLAITSCVKWWANPLSLKAMEADKISMTFVKYNLTFEAEPGSVLFEGIINVFKNYPNSTHPYVSDDFVFVSARRLDGGLKKCLMKEGEENLQNMCLCQNEKAEAEIRTIESRQRWQKSDPNNNIWPVDALVTVADYLTVGSLDSYLKVPNETIKLCGPDVKLIVFVSSAPGHEDRRNMIRKTYGNPQNLEENSARVIFYFGHFKDEKIQKSVDMEHDTYGDILQSDIVDHYLNQSIGELYVYNWLVSHCDRQQVPAPLWVVKADDDWILNIPMIIRVTETNPTAEIIGINDCPQPRRENVPKYMYAPNYWFDFTDGGTVLMRSVILPALLKASLISPIVNLCDVYIQGILMKEIGVQPLHSPLSRSRDSTYKPNCGGLQFMMNWHVRSPEEMMREWEILNHPTENGCTLNVNLLFVHRKECRYP